MTNFLLRPPVAEFVAPLERLASAQLLISQHVAIEVRKQIRRGFVESRDPYGNPWAPLVARVGRPLMLTGLLSSFEVTAVEGSLVVQTRAPYAKTHQFGATIRAKNAPYLRFRVHGGWVQKKQVVIPARPMLPKGGNWGPIWEPAIKARVERVVASIVAGGGGV